MALGTTAGFVVGSIPTNGKNQHNQKSSSSAYMVSLGVAVLAAFLAVSGFSSFGF
jgi:hypothetical protein